MDKINVNQIVRVKLTEYGVNVYKGYYRRFRKEPNPTIDEDGYTTFQLWALMQLYGPHMMMASPSGNPFDTEILVGQDDKYRVNFHLKDGATVPMVYEDEEQFKYYLYSNPILDTEGTIIMKSEVSYIWESKG